MTMIMKMMTMMTIIITIAAPPPSPPATASLFSQPDPTIFRHELETQPEGHHVSHDHEDNYHNEDDNHVDTGQFMSSEYES